MQDIQKFFLREEQAYAYFACTILMSLSVRESIRGNTQNIMQNS